jgi:hypothetical protein
MPTPKLNSLDLTVLFGVPGAKKATASKLELTAALDRLKSGLADLARTDANHTLPLALLLALSRRRGGGGGAPAELGLPHAPSVAPVPISARSTSTQYATARR